VAGWTRARNAEALFDQRRQRVRDAIAVDRRVPLPWLKGEDLEWVMGRGVREWLRQMVRQAIVE
jgi:hypothetical protein